MGRVIRRAKELMHGWNGFEDENPEASWSHGPSMSHSRGNRTGSSRYFSSKSMIGSIHNRLAVDFAMNEIYHARLDKDNDVPVEVIRDSLNDRLTLDANIDQTALQLKIDWALTLFQAGHAVVAPIDTTIDPNDSDAYKIGSLRVGTVSSWYPRSVMVSLYDDREVDSKGQPVNGGIRKDLRYTKSSCMIVENPFYEIMNTPNGMLQRLLRKLELLDIVDENAASGKLDLIMQLPYQVRGSKRQDQAEKRRQDLRDQLMDDELGIGYIDVTEKVIQLNRPIVNQLREQAESLYKQCMDELGLTAEIMNGTASPDALNSYHDRTIEPLAVAFAQEAKRKFLSTNARTRRESIETYRDPLRLIPLDKVGETADHLMRNAVLTANEFRPKIGFFPSKDPAANMLANPNMPADKQASPGVPTVAEEVPPPEPPSPPIEEEPDA